MNSSLPTLRERQLATELDRYTAFAFCRSDILIEINLERQIIFIDGDTRSWFNCEAKTLKGSSLLELIFQPEHDYVAHILNQAEKSNFATEATVQIISGDKKTIRADLSCTYRRQAGVLRGFLALRLRSQAESQPLASVKANSKGLLDPGPSSNNLASKLRHKLDLLMDKSQDPTITLMKLRGAKELRRRMSSRDWQALYQSLEVSLRYASQEEIFGTVGADRLGLVHPQSLDVPALMDSLNQKIKEADPAAKGLEIESSSTILERAKLKESDARTALVLAIENATQSDIDASIKTTTLTLSREAQKILARLSQARQLITERTWHLAYQPVVDLHNHHVLHYEALARMHATTDVGSLRSFLRFSEEIGLITEFDILTFGTVATKLRKPEQIQTDTPISFNLSSRSLEIPDFVSSLEQLLQHVSDLKHKLLFEISDRQRVESWSAVVDALKIFQQAGFGIILDDLGTEEASLEALHQLSASFAKINISNVDFSVLNAITRICSAAGVTLIAKNIEDKDCAAKAINCGIQFGQGNYLSAARADANDRALILDD